MAKRDSKGRFKKGCSRPDTILRNTGEEAPRNTGRTWFKKGNVGYWKGKKRSEETKEKLRQANLGKKSPLKGRKRPALSGKNNPAWKGGVTKRTNQIRNSIEYINWRTKVFKRDKFTCQDCGIIGANLNAHHKISFAKLINTEKEKLIFDIKNGITLCVDCHQKKHPKLNFKINRR